LAGLRISKNRSNFQALIKKAPEAARRLEAKHAQRWASVMIQIMPEDTGAMKESTAVVTGSSGATGVQIGVPYWDFQNSGTVYISGLHFVEESREFVRPDFVKDLRNFVRHLR
jgi:hypothetical protein